jgi:hypothetical protein
VLVALPVVWAAEPATPSRQEIRATMGEIFASIQELLPVVVSDDAYQDPKNRSRIHPALQNLAAHADALAQHGSGKDAGFGFLGRNLSGDTQQILESYEAGDFERSQFLLRHVTEYCVACHSRLPSPGDSPLSEHFVNTTTLAGLEPEDRAGVLIATRRFDEALATLEELFAWPAVHPAEMLGPLTDYLVISIRVKGDLERPVPVLRKFARRPDLWRHLRLDVERWIADLEVLQKRALDPDLETARGLIEEAKGMIVFPADRSALVHYVVASGLLHAYLESHAGDPGRNLAEAYYLQGLVETRIGRDYWVSQSGTFLETAVRLAPNEPFAERAYALLEEEIVLGYSGSGGINVPEDIEKNLAELRKLIDSPSSPADAEGR